MQNLGLTDETFSRFQTAFGSYRQGAERPEMTVSEFVGELLDEFEKIDEDDS